MKKYQLGKTNLHVSRLGLGTVKWGRNQGVKYPTAFSLPTDKEIHQLLDLAQTLGINLLDTAPAYGTSEARLGKVLWGKRKEWVICTKAGEEFINGHSHYDFSPKAIRTSVERSLKRLKTDYLDILLIHSNGDDQSIIEDHQVFLTLNQLKEQGKIRAYGMSTKTVEGGLMTIAAADLAMVTYNPIHTEEKSVITHAYQQQKGIFIKKAFSSGHLALLNVDDPISQSLSFIFAEPGVTSIILGTLNPRHLRENVEKAERFL